VLVTVVILSAFVPTLIAQQLFLPVMAGTEKEEALGAEDLCVGLTSRSHTDHAGARGPHARM